MSIELEELLQIDDPKSFKVHLANWNGKSQPLDVFVRDKSEWKMWNSWRYQRDDYNRKYIFSMIDFYHEKNIWLFGGVFEVLSRKNINNAHSYEVELTDLFKEFIGRLKIKFNRPGRAQIITFENYISNMMVSEILKEPYNGERFKGFENICYDFQVLEQIFRNEKKDWKAALENIKGVYLISDKNNGRRYVGAAYGEEGIWSRWRSYMNTGHGWNDELSKIIVEKGFEYAKENFQLTLLEYMPSRTDDKFVIEREKFWKKALLSRDSKFGYNKN